MLCSVTSSSIDSCSHIDYGILISVISNVTPEPITFLTQLVNLRPKKLALSNEFFPDTNGAVSVLEFYFYDCYAPPDG